MALCGLLAGCGSQSDDPVAQRVEHFYAAIADDDGATACADLAPEARQSLEDQEKKSCDKAILDQQLPKVRGRGAAKVYGSMARVIHPGEVTFLSRFDHRWLLTGVGCTGGSHDRPYDCQIEVG